ncbi:unnamed protein product [Eruca vesicaria subsp. sativa]|uniref:Uncharacterized protein n=1 Tax=Eruca vesicaria subsp. sativa TaxID=29727 RepID=A0ABC8LTU3_ERUVS|nr:unnamed protein product [Eruca vesicaria subsp. sativa]
METQGPTHLSLAAPPRQHVACHLCIKPSTNITAALITKPASLLLLLLLDSLILAATAMAISLSLILNLKMSLPNLRLQNLKPTTVSIRMLT